METQILAGLLALKELELKIQKERYINQREKYNQMLNNVESIYNELATTYNKLLHDYNILLAKDEEHVISGFKRAKK